MKKKLYLVFAAIVMILSSVIVLPATSAYAACGTVDKPLPGFRSWGAGLPCENDTIVWKGGKSEAAVANTMNNIIWTIVLNLIASVSALVGYICIAMIIYGGYLYMSASGNASQLERAKKTIVRTVIGLIICILARSIVQFILNAVTGEAPV